MLPGLEIATAGLFWLASAGGGCTLPKAPQIKVSPVTQAVAYDFKRSQAELGAMKSDVYSPYAPGSDTTTGGLRHDQPETKLSIRIGYQEQPDGTVCLWYDAIDFKIELQPKIYVAREYKAGHCRQSILAHEKEHVAVDRKVINEFSRQIGKTLKQTVDHTGAVGPFSISELDQRKAQLINYLQAVVVRHSEQLKQEMKRRQAQVDTLEEYERISKICYAEGY